MFEINKTDKNACTVKITFTKQNPKATILLASDLHWDNVKCDRALLTKHLEQAQEKNALIILAGDTFCAMQGKFDKRSSKESLRPEHQVNNYLDTLVDTAFEYFKPYAKNIICLGYGNHELSIKNKYEVDLLQRLACLLNNATGSSIQTLGYTGWIKLLFSYYSRRSSRVIWYNHGSGGGGSYGMPAVNREHIYIENADLMMSGHNHRSWMVELVKIKMNNLGNIERRIVNYVKTPTYKDSYTGVEGFETEKGHGPRPLGAYWVDIEKSYDRNHLNIIMTPRKAN